MPISTEWDNHRHTIIRIHLYDPWDLNEYFEAVHQAQELANTVPHPVHLIYDLTDAFYVPLNLLSSIRAIEKRFIPPRGITVCVKVSAYLKSIMKMGIRLFPHLGQNLFFADTLDEAYHIIAQYDHYVPP